VQAIGGQFTVDPDTLGFAITILLVGSIIVTIILQVRRRTHIFANAELGGPRAMKLLSTALLWSLWLCYVVLSVLQTYGFITGF
jgi:solute carrier family 8 (sodium/calcium exchanger)